MVVASKGERGGRRNGDASFPWIGCATGMNGDIHGRRWPLTVDPRCHGRRVEEKA